MTTAKHARLHRMVFPDHLCPSGLKARWLLKSKGYAVDDQPLTSRAATDAFKAEHGVKTTPQVWIEGERIGGYTDLRAHFGLATGAGNQVTYRPLLALLAIAALLALAVSYQLGALASFRTVELFVAIAMVLLAMQKLQNVESFSTMFLNYDLLARRWVPYSYLYAYAEGLAGLLMVAGLLTWFAAPLALFIGTVGALSVFKAVYIDKRELRCACVGGGSRVPLGFVSLTENLIMMAMGSWGIAKLLLV